jgi:pyruvate dehydrogenase phosphatase
MQKLGLLSLAEVDARLKASESEQKVERPGGVTWRYTTAQLPSNNPLEDAYASAIVQKDEKPGSPDGDLLFFSVMDGHAGRHTSQLLSRTLIPAVALELRNLYEDPNTYVKTTDSGYFNKLKGMVFSPSAPKIPYDADPTYVSLAIQTAFSMLDSQIVNAPLRILAEHFKENSKDLPDLTQHPMGVASMLPALSGMLACHVYVNDDSR